MAISYEKLWKKLEEKKINKSNLIKATQISSSTMAKLTKNQSVAMLVLERICAELDCNIADIVEFNNLEYIKSEMHHVEEGTYESV